MSCHIIIITIGIMCYFMSCLWFFCLRFSFVYIFILSTCMLSVFFPFVFVFPLPCPTPGDLLAGLSKFAKLARSVTRSKTLVSQFSSHPVSIKDSTRHVQSHLAHVSIMGFNLFCNLYYQNKYAFMLSSSLSYVDVFFGGWNQTEKEPKNL